MKGFCVIALSLAAAMPVAAEVRSNVQKSFEFGSVPAKLVVTTSGSDITVAAHAGSLMNVVIERKARTDDSAEAAEWFGRYDTSIRHEGSTVFVNVKPKQNHNFAWGNRVRHDVRVTVPVTTEVELRTSGGDIAVRDTRGAVSVRTSGGDLELTGLHGATDARTSGGDVAVTRHRGALEVRTSGGDVEIIDAYGPVVASTSGGDVSVRDARGIVEAQTSGGDIVLEGAIAGGSARTSGGGIRVDLDRSPTQPLAMTTSGSDAVLRVKSDVAFDLDARARKVKVDVPLAGKASTNARRVSGSVNGGGALVTVRSSGGSVSVQPY